jgi:hypothetical protein
VEGGGVELVLEGTKQALLVERGIGEEAERVIGMGGEYDLVETGLGAIGGFDADLSGGA